ncbi:hypothetical protein HYW83_05170, partial [Candidatus Peregrinibacteria bacterium]|nr:hypothetical protein [Candidatus Peregrinibacteria bacterium]
MPPPEQKEKAPETDKRPEFTSEAPFDAKKEWNQQVIKLISDAMGQRYQQHMSAAILTYITTGKDYKNFQDHMEEIVKMRLDAGTVTFFDKEGKPLASFDIAAGMKELIEMAKEHDCDICRRRSRRLRQYEFRNTSYADMLRQIYAESDVPLGRRLAKPPPLSADEIEAQRRLTELFEGRKASRDMILATAESMDDEEYDILAHVSPRIEDDDADEFERHWRFMDGGNEIDNLFNEVPNPAEGYRVNPFNLSPDKKWNRENLRQLIQGSGFWNRNDRLYFKEINEMIYEDRFGDFKKDLEKAGVPKVAADLLEGENLQTDYKKLKKLSAELDDMKDPTKIPEKYKDIWPHREKLKAIIQVLGDYIAYATRLVNYVNQLRWNPAKPAEDRDRLMTEFEIGPDGLIADNPANHVKESLHEIFLYDVSSPREYSGEWSQIFRGKNSHRKITFQDLNGQTATLDGEWFTHDQSPETAYKLAFEQIEERRQNPDGTWTNEIGETEEKVAITHLNDLLQLGIAAYAATPGARPLKEIMDALEKKGVEVSPGVPLHFTGNIITDAENLRQALLIKELADVKKTSTDAEKLMAKERASFIRIGSVVFQKNTFHEQERAQQEREREKQNLAVVKLPPEEAEAIIEQLRLTKKFDEPRLAKIKQTLVGGVAVLLGERPGAGLFFKYELGDGWSIDFAAGGFKGGAFAGAGVSKKFEVREDIDITLHAGPGYLFGSENGPMLGVGASVTKKFSKVDLSFQTGVGVFFGSGGVIPSIPIGVGIDWGKEKEKFQETVSKKELEANVAELDASSNPYEEIRKNPSKYRQLSQIFYLIDSMQSVGLTEDSKKDIFAGAYDMFKEGLRSEAVNESEPGWYRYILPSGFTAGVTLVGGVIPVPYIALTYNLWSRKLVYRVASPVSRAQEISEAEATAAILQNVQGAKTVEAKPLLTTKEVVVDPKTGNVMLKAESSGTIDFRELGHLNRFQQLQTALSKDAKIFVDPADIEGRNMGLILLSPQEAHGDVEVYIDPEL